MGIMEGKQSGFTFVALAIGILLVILLGIVGARVYDIRTANNTPQSVVQVKLEGVVSEGPTSPVCAADVPCTRTVDGHIVEAVDARGNVVASTKTDGSGHYSLSLAPGQYTLVLVPKIGLGNITGNQVDVKTGTNTFDLSVDTGLR